MSRSFRLTHRAEASLIDIARWTFETFGPRQAELYEAELIERCRSIAKGSVHSRSCAVLVEGAEDLRYLKTGEHFLVFLDRPEEVIIVDVLHSRSNLPRHIARLTAIQGSQS